MPSTLRAPSEIVHHLIREIENDMPDAERRLSDGTSTFETPQLGARSLQLGELLHADDHVPQRPTRRKLITSE